MANDTLGKHAPGKTRRWLLRVIVVVLVLASFGVLQYDRAQKRQLVKIKLTKVASTLDPIRMAIATAYQKTSRVPLVRTVVTAANQGKVVTPDWAALDFATMPVLAPEVSSLRITRDGEIIVTLINIGEGIDDTEIQVTGLRNATGITWVYACTSADSMLKRYFAC